MVRAVFNASAMLFSLKSFIAAILALYIALGTGLDNPSWAIVTAYVVAQPKAGAVLSKSVFRLIGTTGGAAMSVCLVPPLVGAPELLSAAIALWLGLCVFFAAIDRTPKSYMFVLAGYTTCVIVFPSVNHPEAIFTTAILRVQEIALGVICSSVVQTLIMPSSSAEVLFGRLDRALRDAARWTADALLESRPEKLDQDRMQLSLAVNELHDLLVHAEYESARHPQQRLLYHDLLLQIERMLPLSAAVDDIILELRGADAMTTEIALLLDEVRAWLGASSPTGNEQRMEVDRLRQRCEHLEPEIAPGKAWRKALTLSLLARLSDLITVHQNCLTLRDAIVSRPRDQEGNRRRNALVKAGPRAIDRDYFGALTVAATVAVVLFTACLLWVASGWEGGGSAVTMAGIFFSLYSSFGNPALALKNKLIGIFIRLPLGALYVLAILPSIDSFGWFAASLAPVLFVAGALLTVPRYSPLAFNLIIGVLSPIIVADHFEPNFLGYLNSGLATLTGVYYAWVMMALMQNLWLEGASARLLKAGWIDIARGRNQAITQWRSRMVHRVALLSMRQAAIPGAIGARTAGDALRDLRTGLSLAALAELRPHLPAKAGKEASLVLDGAKHYYHHLAAMQDSAPPATLLKHIDDAMQSGMESADRAVRRAATLALMSVRRNIFPLAAPTWPDSAA